jgi:hypothetical protein
VPSGHLARHMNARTVLVFGTMLSAAGFALAGLSGGLVGLCASSPSPARAAAHSIRWLPLSIARLRRKCTRAARHLQFCWGSRQSCTPTGCLSALDRDELAFGVMDRSLFGNYRRSADPMPDASRPRSSGYI